MKKTIVACVAVALIAGTTTATAASLITTKDIKDGTIKKRDLSAQVQKKLRKAGKQGATGPQGPVGARGPAGPAGAKGATGPAGPAGPAGKDGKDGKDGSNGAPGVANLESDGPYPGATVLQDGDNSRDYWTDNGELQRSWVQCPDGKTALGGGFTLASDASPADKLATTVTTSAPVQVEAGNPDAYDKIEDDADGSFVPNGWLVEGFYTGSNPSLVVRPHVICANVG